MMRTTSLNAYIDIQSDGTASTQREKIKDFISRFSEGLSRNEVSRLLGIPINATTGRIRELIKKGTICEAGKRLDVYSGKENYVLVSTEQVG